MAGSRDNLEQALIDTGGATPPRKQLQAYTSKVSGPIGPTRSQLLNFHLSSSLSSLSSHHEVPHFFFKILFNHYRFYSTKHSIRSCTSDQGYQGKFGNQTLPHASRYQITPTNLNA